MTELAESPSALVDDMNCASCKSNVEGFRLKAWQALRRPQTYMIDKGRYQS